MKDILGYEGLYALTEEGKVWSYPSKKHRKGMFLVPDLANGYFRVTLYKNKQAKRISIHRLVALTFIPNDVPINKAVINHIDGNKINNHVSNLEWCTLSENAKAYCELQEQKYGRGKTRRKSEIIYQPIQVNNSKSFRKLTLDQVRDIIYRYINNKKETQLMLAKEYGVSRGTIRNIIKGITYLEVDRNEFTPIDDTWIISPNAKLTEDMVIAIKNRLLEGELVGSLAEEYGVSYSCIYFIKRGDNWGWVQVSGEKD
jgi:hypothetical protein